ncbi:MAG TPA: PH domain-containing protein [Steroidobacteraceae bacterium]|nr:PH domain-containing protein [Steroidobacteraceae bacterium]
MSYVDNSLIPDEQVVFRTRLHLVIFFIPMVLLAIAIGLFAYGVPVVAETVLAVAVLWGLVKYIDYASSEFAVTNKRVIIKVGVLRRRTVEMLNTKVEAVAVNQGILGRILGYGNIVVTGTGGTNEAFNGISSPLEFRRAVQAHSS